ncbi:large subunit ribosomal protein L24 [Stella humosa]|uniref:Large ribosomal subunit protein uL24 n=1 Tax=Stella humosa TaxID=94 RepID=A0A3N1MH91_9PROT|nr:50S ribosomal protein L24 [Stella humosa]ROQ00536.1 large subunit ribosomal protein L24 [Stella humosa]BBK30220.1 50S ribosomal protein L24 [Stella humosa]
MSVKMKVKKGDRVVVIAGRDKGKVGTVLRAVPTELRVVVEGVNVVKRHQRQTARDQGGVVEKEAAIHVSNVSHVDPKSNKPTRVGFKNLEDGRKVRVARRSGEVIDV